MHTARVSYQRNFCVMIYDKRSALYIIINIKNCISTKRENIFLSLIVLSMDYLFLLNSSCLMILEMYLMNTSKLTNGVTSYVLSEN